MLIEIAPGDDSDSEGRKEFGSDGIQMDQAVGGYPLIGLNRHLAIPASPGEQLDSRYRRHLPPLPHPVDGGD